MTSPTRCHASCCTLTREARTQGGYTPGAVGWTCQRWGGAPCGWVAGGNSVCPTVLANPNPPKAIPTQTETFSRVPRGACGAEIRSGHWAGKGPFSHHMGTHAASQKGPRACGSEPRAVISGLFCALLLRGDRCRVPEKVLHYHLCPPPLTNRGGRGAPGAERGRPPQGLPRGCRGGDSRTPGAGGCCCVRMHRRVWHNMLRPNSSRPRADDYAPCTCVRVHLELEAKGPGQAHA